MIEFVAGLGLVLLVLSDISRTILLPRPTVKALRLSPLLGRLFIPLWFKATERIKSTRSRQTVRASLAPLLILLALFFWVALLVLGYGLMIHADSKDINPTADAATETVESLGEAVALVSKGGIDRVQYVDILTNTLFGAPVYKSELIAAERYSP